MQVTQSGSNVKQAGKASATTADAVLTVTFNHISLINDGPNELRLAIDESSVTGVNIIYVASGESFEDNIAGTSLHHSVASGAASFRYVLR